MILAHKMEVYVTEQREWGSHALRSNGNTIRLRLTSDILDIIKRNGMKIENFKYERFKEEQNYVYGVMHFKYEEQDDGQAVPPIRGAA